MRDTASRFKRRSLWMVAIPVAVTLSAAAIAPTAAFAQSTTSTSAVPDISNTASTPGAAGSSGSSSMLSGLTDYLNTDAVERTPK